MEYDMFPDMEDEDLNAAIAASVIDLDQDEFRALVSSGGESIRLAGSILDFGFRYFVQQKLQSQFLQIAPDWRHALTLKEAIEERITKDGVIGIGIVATAATAAVGLIATGIATSVSRKRMVL
ncbi:hypothetical protein P8452_27927 [Trifolium repens]|nr:hypothetical protein P8452_27927 [Trifolium repens]